MNSYKLLHAMSGMREDYVLAAVDFLGYFAEEARPRRVNRKLWTTLLVAAVIVSLFTVTAYAMGWFGLRERMIESAPETPESISESATPENSPTPTVEPKRWVSLNGYADSPEYLANAEWLRFREEYLATHTITNDNSWMDGLDEETVNTCHYYGVYEREMLDELNALAAQYGLRLHTHQVTPLTLEDFYRAAGTGAFLTEGSGSGYIYEDGSFKLECELELKGGMLAVIKNTAGSILPISHGIDDPDRYEEWEYTTVHGDTVLLAWNNQLRGMDRGDLRMFYDRDGVFIEAYLIDEGNQDLDGREACEALADKIIFHELLKTEPDFSVLYVEPTVANDPGDTATLADFLASPEGQAARAWSQASNSRRGTEAGQRELADLRPGIVEKYGLLDYAQYWEVGSQEHIDSGMFQDSPFPAINYDEFAEKGYDRRIAEMFYMLGLQDNGVILGYKSMLWIYIPFGSFCDYTFDLTADSYTDEWFYRTECGAVVTLCADFGDTSTAPPVVIYRTANGWLIGHGNFCHNAYELESWADEINYTLFP